jgi:hypothetical protein
MRLAYAHFILGETDAALELADSSIALVDTYWDFYPGAANAIAYARLAGMAGDADRAVPRLRQMLDGYSPVTRAWLEVDPAFDPIRSDSSFQSLIRNGGSESFSGPRTYLPEVDAGQNERQSSGQGQRIEKVDARSREAVAVRSTQWRTR